jgi:PAS domain S-box-containing protein
MSRSIEADHAQERVLFQSRLLAAVGQAVVVTDAAGIVIYWNKAAEQMYGWPEAEALYRPVAEVIIPDQEASAHAALMAQLRRGESWTGEFVVRHRDGTVFPVLTIVTSVFDDSDVQIGMIGVSTDIRTLKQSEEALQRSEERLRGVLEASPLALVELSAEAEVVFWNQAAQRLYGWSLGEVEGRRPRFSLPDDEAAFDGLFERVMAGEHVLNVEVIRRRKNGTRINVSLSMAPLRDGTGRIRGVTSAGLDITHQCQLEADLRQSQKMDGIGRLAGGIAHDFNNLLTVVLGHAEQLLVELPTESSAAERVRAVQRAARRAADLTDQLLTFSRRQVPAGEPTDLNDVVASMESMLARLSGEGIELRVSLGAGPLVVAPDRLQLQQVVLNLVDNARDAMPHGGTLSITTETASALFGPSTALLRVSDTGVGIDAATRANMFEPFFTTKDETKGTGLGLSTVYGVVTQHGGGVDVASRPGTGTVLTVSLPLVPTKSSSEPSEATGGGVVRTGTVLVVEDEADIRDLTREILELHGHVVVEAVDGEGALAAAEAHAGPIDVLVTDVVLPHLLGGPELAERLGAVHPGLQVVFMSGYADQHLAGLQGREARFLAKPFRPDDMAAAVAAALVA